MRAMFALVLVAGLALAGVAVYIASGFINRTQSDLEIAQAIEAQTGGLVEVFVVNKPKNYGDPLTKDDVTPMYWPVNFLPEGVFSDPELLFPTDETKPRYVLRQMETFEPILAVKVTKPGEQAGLTGEIERGMRAFAIRVDAADFLQPGDRVDVYWTGNVSGTEGDLTRLIESKVKIIAVDRSASRNASDGELSSRTVTVAATPEQVARLAQAQASGRLVMSLVGIGDEDISGKIEVDKKGLLGITDQVVVEQVQEKTCTIRKRSGTDVIEVPIPCTN